MSADTVTPDATGHVYPQVAEADAIVREIVAVMTLRLADAGKVFTMGALDEWLRGLRRQIEQQLKNGRSWERNRPTVLAVARDMASIAVIIAHTGDVDKQRVDGAFEAIKAHRRCPSPGSSAHNVEGCWCDCP